METNSTDMGIYFRALNRLALSPPPKKERNSEKIKWHQIIIMRKGRDCVKGTPAQALMGEGGHILQSKHHFSNVARSRSDYGIIIQLVLWEREREGKKLRPT